MKHIILSIKPSFSNEIYNGQKKVELRKKIGHLFTINNRIYIYSSSPEKKISGHALIKKISEMPISDIKSQVISLACISENAFDDYYKGYSTGFVIWLKDIVKYEEPLPLEKLKNEGFTAPQSFCYVSDRICRLLRDSK